MKIAEGLRVDLELGAKTHVLLDAVTLPESSHGSFNELQSKLASEHPRVSSWLLVIGKVQPRKKQTDAVRVLRGLLDSGWSQFGLIVAGDCEPEYLPEMQSVIQDCKVHDRVVMLGNYSDIRALFALQPICLLTSLREALPGSVMEALMAGRPCFMYPCEGAEDIFGPHQTRFVSEVFEPSRLIQKVIQMLSEPALLQSETKALQSRAQELFSIDAHFRSLQLLLQLDSSDGLIDSKS
jgi:glycosyltransferase involved in cell wall biosynthesis